MGYTIAVCGKGGTGKTTIASLIVLWLARTKKGRVLAVDADPNFNLAASLGLGVKENIGQIVDAIAKNPSVIPQGMSKEEYISYHIETSLLEADGFDVLVMGKPEGPGCYCYVNNVLRGIIKRLVDEYDYIVIDNEAGLEHLSRRTMRAADALLVVSGPDRVGIRSALRIQELVDELEIKVSQSLLVVNRAEGSFNLEESLKGSRLQYIGIIPNDTALLNLSIAGDFLGRLDKDSVARAAVERICDQVWQ